MPICAGRAARPGRANPPRPGLSADDDCTCASLEGIWGAPIGKDLWKTAVLAAGAPARDGAEADEGVAGAKQRHRRISAVADTRQSPPFAATIPI
jgi:hypothetical protein